MYLLWFKDTAFLQNTQKRFHQFFLCQWLHSLHDNLMYAITSALPKHFNWHVPEKGTAKTYSWSICKQDTKSKVVLIVKSSFYSFQQWEMMLFQQWEMMLFTLPLLQWTLPDKPVVCNQANIDPFNICSNDVQAKACYWWHTIFICFLHTKRNLKTQSAKPQPHCCTKIQDSHLPESETKSQRALWHTYPWCDL